MLYRNLLLIGILSLGFNLAALATEGHDAGNGGSGVRCGPRGALHLMDFWEAENLARPIDGATTTLHIVRNTNPYENQIETAAQRLAAVWPEYAQAFREQILRLRMIMIPMPAGVRPPETHDLGGLPMEWEDCQRVQIANFLQRDHDEPRLYFAHSYRQLSRTDQAGLWAHEAIYRIERGLGVTDSEHARRVVGLLFSQEVSHLRRRDLLPPGVRSVDHFVDQRYLSLSDSRTAQNSFISGALSELPADFANLEDAEAIGLWSNQDTMELADKRRCDSGRTGGHPCIYAAAFFGRRLPGTGLEVTTMTITRDTPILNWVNVCKNRLSFTERGDRGLTEAFVEFRECFTQQYGPNLFAREDLNAERLYREKLNELATHQTVDTSGMPPNSRLSQISTTNPPRCNLLDMDGQNLICAGGEFQNSPRGVISLRRHRIEQSD